MDVVLCMCQHCGRFWVEELPERGLSNAPRCRCRGDDGDFSQWVYVPADKAKANAKAVLEFLEVP